MRKLPAVTVENMCLANESETTRNTTSPQRRTAGIDSYMVSGAQSVTTTARTSANTTVSVSYSHSVTRSSPGPLRTADDFPYTSSPRVIARTQITTRPPSYTTANISIPNQQAQQNHQFVRPLVTPQKHTSLQAKVQQQHHHQQSPHTVVPPQTLVQLLKVKPQHPVHTQTSQVKTVPPTQQQQLLKGVVPQQTQQSLEKTNLSGVVQSDERKFTPNLLSTTPEQNQLIRQLLLRNTLWLQRHHQQQRQVAEQAEHHQPHCQQLPLPLQRALPTLQQHPESSNLPVSQEAGASSPITCGRLAVRDRPKASTDNMESRYMSSRDNSYVNTCGDLSYSTDLVDTSIYASSPNSLFMYEQEKYDMQGTLGINSPCTSVESGSFGDDFELKSQYETSKDISSCLPVYTTASDQLMTSSMIDSGGGIWGHDPIKSSEKDSVLIKSENPDDSSAAPTLAELNLNSDLLDDIETFINVEMSHPLSCASLDATVKQEPDVSYDKDKTNDPEGQTGVRKPVLTAMTPVPQQLYNMKLVTVKTEPMDVDSCSSGSYNMSFLSLMSNEPKPRTDTQESKRSQPPLDTIKALDISDASTLQQLLSKRPTLLQTRSRNRTVSESTALKSPTRKRPFMATGLESMDRKWEEIKQFIYTEPRGEETTTATTAYPPVKRERTRYDSASSAMTLTSNEDEDSDSDKDYDDDSDSDLDGGQDIEASTESLIGGKDKQYFWQYNVQSKGPKGTRVHFDLEEDPHVLHDFEDPVFDPTNSKLPGIGVSIKHGGKARKGDGNDIVPSPKKLCQIGLQLRKISRQINDFVPVSELPSAARGKTRKEKNKLASRACRLKKKAQHEANKVKLHGLELEHRQLLTVVRKIRVILIERLRNKGAAQGEMSMTEALDNIIKEHLNTMIGGNTADYVNRVVRKVEEGDMTGGIQIQATRSYPKELHN